MSRAICSGRVPAGPGASCIKIQGHTYTRLGLPSTQNFPPDPTASAIQPSQPLHARATQPHAAIRTHTSTLLPYYSCGSLRRIASQLLSRAVTASTSQPTGFSLRECIVVTFVSHLSFIYSAFLSSFCAWWPPMFVDISSLCLHPAPALSAPRRVSCSCTIAGHVTGLLEPYSTFNLP